MLAEPRARAALVDNFFGQWLQTRNVWLLTPDANTKFPWFDDNLRSAIVRETELFLDDQLKADRGIAELLTSDSTFLNEQLARHYGIPGVYGSHFRRVTLADENRWGLLGKASVLAVTSYPTRTSPTIRGKWLLENILAAPVPPPPPNANTNLDESKLGKSTTVREMLEQHRANPVCASCHARMDPLGFSLENFDAVGQWRTRDGDAAINATGVLLDGTKVDGPAALRRALVAQKEQFVRTVTGKLLTYAIGREMEYADAPAIRAIVRAAAADDYRWSSDDPRDRQEPAVSDEEVAVMMVGQADIVTSPAKSTARRHPAFFPAMSSLLVVLVFLGFAPTYYLRPESAGPIPAYLHVHGAAMTIWFLLLLVQTGLIATRRRAVHRRLGFVGAVVAAVIVVLNPLVVARSVPHLIAGRRLHPADGPDRRRRSAPRGYLSGVGHTGDPLAPLSRDT